MKAEGDRDSEPPRQSGVCPTCMWWEETVQYILVAASWERVGVVCCDCLGTGLQDARERLAKLLLDAKKREGEERP